MKDAMIKKTNGVTVPIALVGVMVMGLIGYGKLSTQVETNEKGINAIKDAPIHIAEIRRDVQNIQEDIGEMKTEQKEFRAEVKKDMVELLKAVRSN